MRSRVSLCGIGLWALVLASPASAQVDTIRADPAAGLRLTIGSDTSHTYLVQDAGRRKIMTYVEIITEAPEGYLIIGRNVRPDGQTFSVDSLIVAQGSLAPLRHSDRSPAGRMDVRYEGGRLRGTNDSAGTSRQVDDAVSEGAFDYSMARLVINQLPLEPGYSGVVITHDIRRGAVPLPFRVTGEEEITAGGKASMAWKVEVDLGQASASRWIDQETRKDLRTVVTFAGGQMVAEPAH